MSKTRTKTEEKILKSLRAVEDALHTEDIAARVGLTRHTVSKYLQVLNAQGRVKLRQVGNAKLWRIASSDVVVRTATLDDMAAICDIERVLQEHAAHGMPHKPEPVIKSELNVFRRTMEHHLSFGEPQFRLVAEVEDQVVGYIIGEVRLWEFGLGQEMGWVNVLAVHPEHQHRGVGKHLGEAILKNFDANNIQKVRTLIDSYSGELIAYFRSLGFQIIPHMPMEREMPKPKSRNGK